MKIPPGIFAAAALAVANLALAKPVPASPAPPQSVTEASSAKASSSNASPSAPAAAPPAAQAPASPGARATPALTPGEILYNQTRDAATVNPWNWDVSIYKSRHELIVYYKGRLFRKYDAVFGRNLDHAPKEFAEDRRTPEGVYTIIKKYPSRRFRWFLRLNYPNFIDRQRYIVMRQDGALPSE